MTDQEEQKRPFNTTKELVSYRCSECGYGGFMIEISNDGKFMVIKCITCFQPFEFDLKVKNC